jgi:histidinol dehydrogenase
VSFSANKEIFVKTPLNIPIISISSPSGKRQLDAIREARQASDAQATRTVEEIIAGVRSAGDKALLEFTKKFDGITLSEKHIKVQVSEVHASAKKAPAEFKKALKEAAKRIVTYHTRQKNRGFSIKTSEGRLSQKIQPLTRVGVYVPGGKALYPSSVLMDVIPARIAGVKEIAVVTPPRGGLDPKIAFALEMLGISEVYQVGGAQAIAALAYGTKTIKRVDKIVGPGNLFVALAKKAVYGDVDIDAIAGPSEVVVLVDGSATPQWAALDLLAQAEHGSGSESALCVTESASIAKRVQKCLMDEIAASDSRAVFQRLKPKSICICIAKNRAESIRFINDCAPEHLEIMTKDYSRDLKEITNASAIFCGHYAPAVLGDYYIGTNHVLPTGRAARFASPLGVESFVKRVSIAEIPAGGLQKCAKNVSTLARAENFIHHALCVERRLQKSSQ